MTKVRSRRFLPRRLAALAVVAGGLACAAAGAAPAAAQSGGAGLGPVEPLVATINAAAYGPWPANGATIIIQRYDDSREHDTIQQALENALSSRNAGTGRPLDLEFEVYVIRSGVPVLAKGILEHSEVRRDDPSGAPPPGIDVTELQGRTAGVEGNVFHQRRDSFSATMRLEVTVTDSADGAYLWRGWVDTPLNGLSRAQAASLVAAPLLESLGQTVARREIVVTVPDTMGGAPDAAPAPDATTGTQ